LLREATFHQTEKSVERLEAVERLQLSTAHVEIRNHTERVLREVEVPKGPPNSKSSEGIEAPQQDQIAIQPLVEINIGRIEVRAASRPTEASKPDASKPKGVIELNEYLRRRSEGAL
jgi:hypothetical protein